MAGSDAVAQMRSRFWRQGEPLVWMTAGSLGLMLLATAILLALVLIKGLAAFWPADVARVELKKPVRLGGRESATFLGEYVEAKRNPDTGKTSVKYKIGNRKLNGFDFLWVETDNVKAITYPDDVVVLERMENGNFYGYLRELSVPSLRNVDGGENALGSAIVAAVAEREARTGDSRRRLLSLGRELSTIDREIKRENYRRKVAFAAAGESSPEVVAAEKRLAALEEEKTAVKADSDALVEELKKWDDTLRHNSGSFVTEDGAQATLPLLDLVRCYRPNAMGTASKCLSYAWRVWELFFHEPRESNTEGGLFPAIFGTVMLIFIMAAASFPLGVMAGVYLGEYAREGALVKLVRIAVNNLAGIPSIVYGIFGLGFFIYTVGAQLDRIFYPDLVDAGEQVFGTGGILWASMTLGLLTVPVVIVSTEEALRTIPRGIKEGSLALGATRFQTLWRVLLPMASPGIMTGFILAMARAAGEVAPLMITGVVKLAPTLPVDGSFPYLHLDRKFMHLGFHIYDVGFQSPNVEAAKPMVYVTTLLLLLIVAAMSGMAIWLRNRMRGKYQMRSI